MTLQQLRYLIAITECGSITAAAHELFISQSSLSSAVKEVEDEAGIQIFVRSNRGITLTNDGLEFLGYARQVVEQADLMAQRYAKDGERTAQRLSISTQHYAFSVEAFVAYVDTQHTDTYNYTLRETRTSEIIDDVKSFRSDIGILYLDSFNEQVLGKALDEAGLVFTSLFKSKPHIFVGEHHPLAGRKTLKIQDLEEYPRYSFEQGTSNSFYFAEEPLSELPHTRKVLISDRGTLSNLLTHHNGYTVSTGVLSSEMHTGIVSIPLECDEMMDVGYILHKDRRPTSLLQGYIDALKEQISDYGF